MVATQFERHYARQTFPCFDEPEYKAVFRATLVRKIGYISLSNMQTRRQETR